MTLKNVVKIAAVAAIGSAMLLMVDAASAQKTKGKSRPAGTKQLMKGIVQPNCAGLGASLKDKGPADDDAWALAATQAACLNEMSYVLMDDGRCPDGDWAGAAKTLRGCSEAVLAALEKKDLAAAQAAFKQATTACAACHKVHKK